MRIFRSEESAQASADKKIPLFLNSECPFIQGKDPIQVGMLQVPNSKLCGNWCALFYAYTDGELSDRIKYIILGCKGTDKHLYVKDVDHGTK